MALFTDGSISTIEDLAAQDAGVMGVAGAEGIDLSGKLALAQEELGVELAALMPRANGTPFGGLSLGNVVVTAPLRMWHAFHTLELVYRDAYNNQLNDRYKGKWEQYRELARWAWDRLLETGVGIAADPVERAGAPRLSAVAGGGAAEETTYYARAAWVNGRGEEGAAGEWSLLTVPAGMALEVRVAEPPANAVGWNAYLGTSADEERLQNDGPLAPAVAWIQGAVPACSGRKPGNGQGPSYLRALPRILQRG